MLSCQLQVAPAPTPQLTPPTRATLVCASSKSQSATTSHILPLSPCLFLHARPSYLHLAYLCYSPAHASNPSSCKARILRQRKQTTPSETIQYLLHTPIPSSSTQRTGRPGSRSPTRLVESAQFTPSTSIDTLHNPQKRLSTCVRLHVQYQTLTVRSITAQCPSTTATPTLQTAPPCSLVSEPTTMHPNKQGWGAYPRQWP